MNVKGVKKTSKLLDYSSLDPENSKGPKIKCDRCDFRSKTNEELVAHLDAYHSTENTNRCNVCRMKADDASQLRNHMKLRILKGSVASGSKVGVIMEIGANLTTQDQFTQHSLFVEIKIAVDISQLVDSAMK